MDEEIKLINRGRGKVLLYGGHQYYRHVLYRNGTSNWRCKMFKASKLKCAGSVTLSSDQKCILVHKIHHDDCAADQTQNVIDDIVSEHCEEAVKGKQPAPRIFKKGLVKIADQGLHLASKKPVPTFKEKKDAIYRRRNKNAGVSKCSVNTALELEVPIQFQDFLLADYADENGLRIVVFCSEEGKEQLKTSKHFFMDGTYKACLGPFKQIYSIHGDIGSDINNTNIVPLVFALMTEQTKKAYSILFDLIRSRVPEWQPTKVTVDFEDTAIKALSEIEVEVKGCHYHFSNALLRKAKKLNLLKDRDDRRIIYLCINLALLPQNLIDDGWEYIKNKMDDDIISIKKFKRYFEKYWMKKDFHKIWDVFGERHRTNNAVEGWHHALNTNINKNEVQLLQILNILREEASLVAIRINQLQKFQKSSPPKRRRMYVKNDTRIMNAQLQVLTGEISVGHFLDKLR